MTGLGRLTGQPPGASRCPFVKGEYFHQACCRVKGCHTGYFSAAKRDARRPDSWQVRQAMLVLVTDSGLSFHCWAIFA